MKKKLKVFTLTEEEFRKRFPVEESVEGPKILKGYIARVVSVRPSVHCQNIGNEVSQF